MVDLVKLNQIQSGKNPLLPLIDIIVTYHSWLNKWSIFETITAEKKWIGLFEISPLFSTV